MSDNPAQSRHKTPLSRKAAEILNKKGESALGTGHPYLLLALNHVRDLGPVSLPEDRGPALEDTIAQMFLWTDQEQEEWVLSNPNLGDDPQEQEEERLRELEEAENPEAAEAAALEAVEDKLIATRAPAFQHPASRVPGQED